MPSQQNIEKRDAARAERDRIRAEKLEAAKALRDTLPQRIAARNERARARRDRMLAARQELGLQTPQQAQRVGSVQLEADKPAQRIQIGSGTFDKAAWEQKNADAAAAQEQDLLGRYRVAEGQESGELATGVETKELDAPENKELTPTKRGGRGKQKPSEPAVPSSSEPSGEPQP